MLDVLQALRAQDDTESPADSFESMNPDLDGISPLNVLLGALPVERPVHEDVPDLLASPAAERHALVVAAAGLYAACASGWRRAQLWAMSTTCACRPASEASCCATSSAREGTSASR